MEIKDIKALIKAVAESDINELEWEDDQQRLLLKRGADKEVIQVPTQPAQQSVSPPQAPAAESPAPATEAQQPAAAGQEAQADDSCETITSPIVGTFYRAPSPESDPYVQVGDVVEAGGVFCIVEAMKLMNEIEAEFKCRIVEVMKDNAQPVEFGDALFRVERLSS